MPALNVTPMKMKLLRLTLLSCLLSLSWLPATSFAGFDEGLTAYKKGDFATALREWKPLAEQGSISAQLNLAFMYKKGQGVAQDFKEAVRWYRLAADQHNAIAQLNLGVMYDYGRGVAQSKIVAYALYNISAANDPSADNNAASNREKLVKTMSGAEIETGQDLTRKMMVPGQLVKALDSYIR